MTTDAQKKMYISYNDIADAIILLRANTTADGTQHIKYINGYSDEKLAEKFKCNAKAIANIRNRSAGQLRAGRVPTKYSPEATACMVLIGVICKQADTLAKWAESLGEPEVAKEILANVKILRQGD